MRTAADKRWRVEVFQKVTGESEAVATACLDAEEWDVQDALATYRHDQAADVVPSLAFDPHQPLKALRRQQQQQPQG